MRKHFAGLDTIRFICAFYVCVYHYYYFGILPLPVNNKGFITDIVTDISYQVIFLNGPQAVIVFFVISGFCIHFPFIDVEKPNYYKYYVRRYARIGIPFFFIVFLFNYYELGNSVLWSIEAELIYYTIYPLLIKLKQILGWKLLIAASFLASYLVIFYGYFQNPYPMIFPWAGIGFNWLIGLPCWLLGCYLAEQFYRTDQRKVKFIWGWRLLMLSAFSFASALNFLFSIGWNMTLTSLSIVVYFWLAKEISYFQTSKPPKILEWAGRWSYSLYLCHLIIVFRYPLFLSLPLPAIVIIVTILCLLFSYVFYLLIEQPANQISKKLASKYGKSKGQKSDAVTAVSS